MKARVLLPALFLAGCAAPTPDPTLTSLAAGAQADATSGTPQATLRAKQAEELYSEIARLCGRGSDGATPPECVHPTGTPTPILLAVGSVPDSSMPLVSTHYVQLAMLSAPVSYGAAPEGAQQLHDWESGVVYALETSQAFSTSKLVSTSMSAHKSLLASLNTSATTPVAFDLSAYPALSQPGELVEALESDSATKWMQLACTSKDGVVREFALIQAGNAASRYAAAVKSRGGDPAEAEFLRLAKG